MSFRLSEIVENKSTIALSGHVRPDGDCIGSVIGLYCYLTEQYPEKQIDVYLEQPADSLKYIKKTSVIKSEIPDQMQYDLFICLDCGDEKRLGFSAPLFENAKTTACIDHHISNQSFADYNEIVPDASSTSELVYHLLENTLISKESAEALYMGIVHDTGVFQYSCTAPETMEAAAALMRKGINSNELIDKTYFEKSFEQMQITGKVLLECKRCLDDRCIYASVSRKDLEEYGVSPKELDGIVSRLREVKGVETAIFMYELEPNEYKISLRSQEAVDVSRIAQYFGGGGHVRAAGASMEGPVEVIVEKLKEQIAIQLDK